MDTQAVTMFQETVKSDGDLVFVKPICDFFKIDYLYHTRTINESILLNRFSTTKACKELFGDDRPRVVLTKQGFLMWILQLNPQIIEEIYREKFLQFQILVFDFLFGSREADINFSKIIQDLDEVDQMLSHNDKDKKTLLARKKELLKQKESFIAQKFIQTSLVLK